MAMEMDHSFTVPVPPDRAWDVLLDVEKIAPCMPGATVDEFDGEVVTGRIKVKVGPVSLTYRGTAKFTERDPDARVILLEASGKETRGAGTASATVRATLEPESGGEGDHRQHAHDDERDRAAGPVRPRGDDRGRQQAGRAVRPEPAPADRRRRRGGRERCRHRGRRTADGAGRTADAGRAAGTTQDGPGSTQPSPVVPAAATTSTPTAPTPRRSPRRPAPTPSTWSSWWGPRCSSGSSRRPWSAAVLALLGRRLFRRGAKG